MKAQTNASPNISKTNMTINPKRVVQQLSSYVHTEEHRESYIKLDMNENTVGFNELSGYEKQGSVPNIYPDSDDAVQMLGDFLGVPKNRILLTNGCNEALSLVSSTFIEPGEDVAVISKPCFFFVYHCLLLAGAKVTAIPAHQDLSFDTQGIERALKERPKLAMFSSPDNPSGSVLDGKTILEWCSTFPETLFVIDEAYAEYCNFSLLPELPNYSNLMLLKSLSKAWGLAGLRLGAIFADERLISYLNLVKLPFSVNAAALSGLRKMLAVPEKIKEAAEATMERKAAVIKDLRERGYKVIEGAGNFFLLSLGLNCAEFTKFMKENGILVRNLTQDISKKDDHLWGLVRISIGTVEENRRFIEAVDRFKKNDTSTTAKEETTGQC